MLEIFVTLNEKGMQRERKRGDTHITKGKTGIGEGETQQLFFFKKKVVKYLVCLPRSPYFRFLA